MKTAMCHSTIKSNSTALRNSVRWTVFVSVVMRVVDCCAFAHKHQSHDIIYTNFSFRGLKSNCFNISHKRLADDGNCHFVFFRA
jgi:hypothetical protein